MNGKWTLPLAALALSLTVTPFSAFAAPEEVAPQSGEKAASEALPQSGEKIESEALPQTGEKVASEALPQTGEKVESEALPPSGEKAESPKVPGDRPKPDKRSLRRGQARLLAGMKEEQRAQFIKLNRKIEEALKAYRADPSDSAKAALKELISERFDLWQKFAIERAEKVLAREKARLENKEQEVERQLDRLLRPRGEKSRNKIKPRESTAPADRAGGEEPQGK